MNQRLIELAERRARLRMQIALQREELGESFQPVQGVLFWMDRVADGARYLRQHPLILVTGLGVLLAMRPRRIMAWGMRGWSVWRLVRSLRLRVAAALGTR